MSVYQFYVKDKETWFGVFEENGMYRCVEQCSDPKPFTTTYPINNDPKNWINTVTRHQTKGEPMNLPHQFQMRTKAHPGYTHNVKMNAHGDYEITWARGYAEALKYFPMRVYDEYDLKVFLGRGDWVIVDEGKKEQELPDEFCVKHALSGNIYVLKKGWEGGWKIYDTKGVAVNIGYVYVSEEMCKWIEKGQWEIITKRVLTAEEQRRKKDFEERIAALDSSIKLNEQDIEHKQRLVSNYKAQQNDLRAKIAELEGRV